MLTGYPQGLGRSVRLVWMLKGYVHSFHLKCSEWLDSGFLQFNFSFSTTHSLRSLEDTESTELFICFPLCSQCPLAQRVVENLGSFSLDIVEHERWRVSDIAQCDWFCLTFSEFLRFALQSLFSWIQEVYYREL